MNRRLNGASQEKPDRIPSAGNKKNIPHQIIQLNFSRIRL